MTSSRLLARNTALNLAGQIAPLVVAVVAIPLLIDALGVDRFGVLTLTWSLIGYFGLFDFGIGRALTQAASEALGRGDERQLRDVSAIALVIMFALGCVGAVIIAVLTPWLCYRVLNMPAAVRAEASRAFYIMAVSLPFVLSTIGFRGLFEAHQHFGLATALRIPFSLFNFIAPLLIIPFSHSLVPIVAALAGGRVVGWATHFWFCTRRYPWLRGASMGRASDIMPLLRYGGWLTVSNIISPMMVYMDRFAIGAMLSTEAVTYYATPFDVISKMLFVPAAVLGVFFPAFASTFVRDRARTAAMFDRSSRVILLAMFPVVMIFVGFAREGLTLWVGSEFARQSTLLLQVLAAGVLINSYGQIPSALIQAIGRADLAAKGHMVELPIYTATLIALASAFGLVGVAAAWTFRMVLDTAILCWLARRHLAEAATSITRSVLSLVAMLVALVLVGWPTGLLVRLLITLSVLVAYATVAWLRILLPSERLVIRDWLRLDMSFERR